MTRYRRMSRAHGAGIAAVAAIALAAPLAAYPPATAAPDTGVTAAAPDARVPAVAPGAGRPVAEDPPTPQQAQDRLRPMGGGQLRFDPAFRAQRATVGGFTVRLDPDSGLRVTDTSTGVDVWRVSRRTAFLTGSRSRLAMTEFRGYFWPDVSRSAVFSRQTVQRMTSSSSAVTITGRLSDGDRSLPWTLTLTASVREAAPILTAAVTTGRASGKALSSIQVALRRPAGAAVNGFGAQFRPYDLGGTLFPIMPREQGVGRGEEPITATVNSAQVGAGGTLATTYGAWPSWLSAQGSAGWVGAQVVGPARDSFGTVDLRGDKAVRLELRSRGARLELASGPTPVIALQRRETGTTVTGIPAWTGTGAVLGLQGGTAEVRSELQTILDAGGRVSAVWLQDWSGRRITSFGDRLWWTWQLDTERYPGWDTLVDDLDARGIKVLTYVNPMLTDAAAKTPPPPRNLYREAADAGYLVTRENGEPYLQDQGQFTAAMIDLTSPAARDWYADVIATQVLAGKVAGMMADFGEGLPYDGVLQAGSGAQWHNAYPRLWAQTVRQACLQAGKPDCVAFFRSGASGMARFAPLFWAGDQMVSFAPEDGMPSALAAFHAAGASGWPLMHSDVGGYTSVALVNYVRPVDLLPRWAQLEAFGVFMRTHEGNQPASNLQVYSNPEQATAFARATRIYAALADYRRTVVDQAVATRVPAIRHPSLVFPGTAAAEADEQFFLGAHLMVAPVMAKDATSVSVTFPPGQWQHVLTGQVFAGDTTTTVAAPLDTPAAFVRTDDPVGAGIRAALAAAGLTTG